MCAERLGQFVTLALVLATFDLARGTDATYPPEGPQDRSSQQKGRLSLQNTGKCVRPCGHELRERTLCTHAARPGRFAQNRTPTQSAQTPGVARDVQRKAQGQAMSAPGSERPESARASRVMKWLGQDLLLSSPGVEGK